MMGLFGRKKEKKVVRKDPAQKKKEVRSFVECRCCCC